MLRHPPVGGGPCPNTRVALLPPDTTSLTQPAGQGVAAARKAQGLRRTYAQATAATEDAEETLMKPGRVTSVTASGTVLGLGAMSPRNVRMASGRRHRRFIYDKDEEAAKTKAS